MKKPSITKTLGPIHFEDLDPRRFEDLVRELLYDYKDWQSIEATGRSGTDDGFDVRAYEKTFRQQIQVEQEDNDTAESTLGIHPMEGNLWMIQCKRESKVGPTKVLQIISENITSNTIPYGYILVAPSNFSKKSYDSFREELKKRGVMEFYLWGKAELEDMLHLPKFDRILFTFFGISLVSRKRSKTTEQRSRIVIKNKLYKILGEEHLLFSAEILIRDINDVNYPFSKPNPDFNLQPAWAKHKPIRNGVRGIWFILSEHYGYFDENKNEWDLAPGLDLKKLYEDHETEEEIANKMQKNRTYRNFWQRLPINKQVQISIWGLIKYEDINIVDEKGDPLNKMVHLYTDFVYSNSPFCEFLHVTNQDVAIEYAKANKISIFPSIIPEFKDQKVHRIKSWKVNDHTFSNIVNSDIKELFDVENKFSEIKPGHIIQIENATQESQKRWIEITRIYKTSVDSYEKENGENITNFLFRTQLGDDYKKFKLITIYEFVTTFEPGE
jgi:hypothetical protein